VSEKEIWREGVLSRKGETYPKTTTYESNPNQNVNGGKNHVAWSTWYKIAIPYVAENNEGVII
jgi:hypothetical protein